MLTASSSTRPTWCAGLPAFNLELRSSVEGLLVLLARSEQDILDELGSILSTKPWSRCLR